MALNNKIDFVLFVTATNANANGDPLNGNRPRTDYNGYGEISDVCIKRKIRNRMQDLGENIFVQSDDKSLDEFTNLSERAKSVLKSKVKTENQEIACQTWLDVRSFGQVFAFKAKGKKNNNEGEEESAAGVSIGVRGPVSVQCGVSCNPIDIETMQITKSVNSEPGDKKSSDTMGSKHKVVFGLYEIKGAINVQLAEKTGFSDKDAKIIKECLRTLFVNDASSARPEGSMEVCRLYWWEHSSKEGQYSSAKVHRSVKVSLKEGITVPTCFDDYKIELEALPGLEPEIIDGI